MDAGGEPIAESKPRVKHLERAEWLLTLLCLVSKTGIDRLEFLRGGAVEVVSAKEFFLKRMKAVESLEDEFSPRSCHYCRTGEGSSCDCV